LLAVGTVVDRLGGGIEDQEVGESGHEGIYGPGLEISPGKAALVRLSDKGGEVFRRLNRRRRPN
jgi:hypothetical protein